MGVEDGRKHPLVFAYYVTGHGFGHATRVVEVVRHLIDAGHDVHVVTGAPEFVFTTEIQSPRLFLRKVLLDCGAVQADALTVDRLASLEKYSETAVVPRDSILETEVEWLNLIKADLVVSDVVPVACRAAADAGIRSVCVTNFSWDFIYAEYVMAAGIHHRSIVWQIAEDYSHCEFLIRLPGYCPMPAYRDVIDVPLVVRRLHKSREQVRKELGIGEDVKVVILNFGGQPAGWKLKEEYLPSGWLCLVCGASDSQDLPPNFIKLAKDVYTPDLIAASDCMLGKIGYGTVSEALAYKLPFVFVRRDYFNEEPFLRNMLEPAGWKLKEEYLPSGWLCLVCGASDSQDLPPNFIKLAKDVYTPDLIAASDCMLGKIGYGTVSEALAYKLPFVFVRRDYFNEEPFLRNMLEPAGWKLKEEYLPSGWLCLVCGASDSQDLPPNFIKLAKDVYTPDLIAASDCMLGKIGYGTVSEALAYKLPFVFVRRDYFNEEPFLRNMLEPAGWKLKEEYLPSGWLCLVCGASDSQDLPPNFIKLAKDVYTPDLIAASDCMLGKIGYGTVSEALAYKLPFVFVRRDYFNEEPFLRNMLEHYQGGVEMIRRDLLTGHWKPYLERAMTLHPCYEGGTNGGEVAACILQDTASGKNYISNKVSGARRLRDAIVLGYQLQRMPGRDLCIPDWYANAENELGLRTGSPTAEMRNDSFLMDSYQEDFEILHGDLLGLPDTVSFLKSLAELDAAYDSVKNTGKHKMRERMAAAALFDWEEEIFVARAPGRLDVMGGIADYSGSLVLQMPIREACHVAVQKIHPGKERLWKHAQARKLAKGEGSTPVLQIVSYGSELSNRGPTFDMDLSDFWDGEQPMSYEKARNYFAQDPSQRWAAYVAGTILVLMKELGIRFENSISMLVSSAVPEGKGVSSSASVEVASMSAIAAAHGLKIPPRELALLCQKVENHVVGAPCGVMDQMTSACGESNKLLAMVCQPAEVLGLVDIPSHIRVWGIDSGIRHSVGGTDYGSVRVGAFMGRRIIIFVASTLLSQSLSANGMTPDDAEEDGVELLESEALLDYLCNLSPHRYEALYSKVLPETLLGETFVEKYTDHNDPVTVIDKKRNYGLRAAARHPIYENFRVKAFKALLTSATSDDQLTALGELMYQCHYSYSACGLGSDGTDRLVQLVQEMQHSKMSKSVEGTLYGAKITGGGSGGTVCVIGRNCLRSSEQIFEIQQKYKSATGYLPIIFEGSSPGAGKFGHLRIRRRKPSNKN